MQAVACGVAHLGLLVEHALGQAIIGCAGRALAKFLLLFGCLQEHHMAT